MICDLSLNGITLGTCGTAMEFRKGPLTVRRIQNEVMDYYDLYPGSMTSAQRFRAVARPRQIAMYLASRLTHHSLPAIGRLFGGRDHTTVIHAIRKVNELCVNDPMVAADVEALRERLAA